MLNSNKIEGSWYSYTYDFILNYDDKRKLGAVKYGNKVDNKGRLSATVWHDKDGDGWRDKGEDVIAKYKADASVVMDELDYYSVETGVLEIHKKKAKFTLLHDGDVFGQGKILDMDYFFG